jgi:hypothetical protein
MAWTNVIAGLALGALAAFLLARAKALAADEQEFFHFGRRQIRMRVLNYRIGGGFLGLIAVALVVAGSR